MGFLLSRAFLFINAFNIATENPIYKYRFKVYPVDNCPMNASEFESAARRRNCTGDSRYLCAPDKYLSNLIEFCTDRNRLFYEKGNCVRLEGTGDLNHYNCTDRFTSGCPTEPYQDDKVFEYPMCLAINRESKCFISEKNCPERTKEVDKRNKGKPEYSDSSYFNVIFIFMISVSSIVLGTMVFIFRKEIKKRTGIKRMYSIHLQMNTDNVTDGLLQGVPEDDTNVKDVPKDDRNNEIQVNENAVREYLSKGELTAQHIRCIIVGCAHAGKTTLLRRLKDISLEEAENITSTEIIDVHVNLFEVNEEEGTIQCIDEMNELPLFIIPSNMIKNDNETEEEFADKGVQRKRESEEIDQENIVSIEDSTHGTSSLEPYKAEQYEPVTENENMGGKQGLLRPFGIKQSKADVQDREEIPHSPDKGLQTSTENIVLQTNENTVLPHNIDENYAISKIMDAVKQLSKEKDLRPRITFLDFAGQSLYYAFHQIYLSPKTCYILVLDMTKDLQERVPDTDEQCASRFASWTYEDYYKFWLKSIDSFSDTDAPVVVVGTHADKISKDECKNFFETFFDLVYNHFDLRRHLNRKRQFTIGFPKSGSSLEELKDIKKCIASLVHDPEKIKPVWAMFEHILEKEKIGKIISRKTISHINEKISEEFRMTDRDITDMLLFLHRVGSLLYFDEDQLKETIILDIQWFAQAFKSIVAYDVDVRKNDEKRERFLRTGEIDDHELNRIWGEKDKRYLANKTKIISYMEELGLLAACHMKDESLYYIPSMNRRKFKDTEEKMTKSSILCFQFDKHGQLPAFLFYGIVIKCTKIPGWSFLREKNENCIYDKVACFSFRHLIVVMCLCKFQIQVQVRDPRRREIDKELLEKVQNLVKEKIEECKKYKFEVGYKCEKGIFNDENEDSFVAFKEFTVAEPICYNCPFSKKHFLGREICWVETGKQTERRAFSEIPNIEAKETNMHFSENWNYLRMTQIISGPLTNILQAVLRKEIRPSDLSKVVKEFASKSKFKRFLINKEQESLVNSGDYSRFDVVLLYLLLRNVCAIPSHANRWGNNPSPADRSVSANIDRIRLIRNQFAHTLEFSISDKDFDIKCTEIFDIVQQLEHYVGTTVHRDKVQEIISRDHDLNKTVLQRMTNR